MEEEDRGEVRSIKKIGRTKGEGINKKNGEKNDRDIVVEEEIRKQKERIEMNTGEKGRQQTNRERDIKAKRRA